MGKYSKHFSDQDEALLLSLFVTEPYADIFGVYDTLLPAEQFATLGAAYSRTHEKFQSRLMRAIDDGDLLDREIIDSILRTRGQQEELKQAVESETAANPNLSLLLSTLLTVPEFVSTLESFKSIPKKAALFIQKWAQEYGHNSIKEMGIVRFCCENIPDYSEKPIVGHPLARPQVKSSRYIDWTSVLHLVEENLDLQASKYAEDMVTALRAINASYIELSDSASHAVRGAEVNRSHLDWYLSPTEIQLAVQKTVATKRRRDPKWEPTSADLDALSKSEMATRMESFDRDARRSIFDTTRYLLTPAMPTSLACSVDARAMEDILSEFMTSPMLEDQRVGRELWAQVRRLQPVLLGDKCHAKRNEYEVNTASALRELARSAFPFERERDYEVTARTNFIKLPADAMFSEAQLAAALIFPHGYGSYQQYFFALSGDMALTQQIIDTAFEGRGRYDAPPLDLGQGGAMREFLMDYGGYRDVFRHRRGARSRQRLCTFHGFETPALIPVAGLSAEYDRANEISNTTFRKVVEHEPHLAQLVVTFAHRCRSLYSWSVVQDIYFAELRGRPAGNESYRSIAWDVAEWGKKSAPQIWKHVEMDYRTYPAELTLQARKWYDEECRSSEVKSAKMRA